MTDVFQNTSLDTQVFQDELDFKTLENILETLDHVEAKKISREKFKNLKGNFLVENGQDKKGEKKYILYLPEDLKQFELAYIIDSLTKKFNIQDYANIEEIINKTKIAVSVILRQDWGKKYLENLVEEYNIPKNFVKKVKTTKLDFGKTRDFIKEIKGKRKNTDLENEDNFKNKELKIKNKRLGEEKEDLENIFSETQKLYSEEFNLTFFRKGINMLRLGMETLTQVELQAKMKGLEENGFKKEVKRNGNITKGEEEVVIIKNDLENFDKKERLLREKIGIEEFKQKLKQAREEKNQKRINELELEASNKIIKTLYETYSYYNTEEKNGYQANKIKEFKEAYCVGFSLLGHAFLSELKIKHNGLEIIDKLSHNGHSALEVIIGGKKYYFDATYLKKVYEYNYDEEDKVGAYYNHPLFKGYLLQAREPEKILLSQMLNNKGLSLYRLGKNKEAIKMYEKAIELNPTTVSAYINKGNSLSNLERYEEAIKIYEKAIELNPTTVSAYINKGNSLSNLERYEEAIKMYDKAIELNPKDAGAYINKGVLLKEKEKRKLGELYKYTYNKLKGNISWFEILYRTEKQKIDKFIEKKDYDGLRKYLWELEKK